MEEIIEVKQADMIQAINRAEVDIQIATAKQYPRVLDNVLNQIRTYATMDTETAEDCFYALRRGTGDDASVIEGISVRLAEIIAGAWGNLRVQSRIIGNDGRTITCQGICHDLETNVAVSVEVKRRITDKHGKTYSEDMQVLTGNAAAAIAFRNAVLKVVPKAVTKKVVNEIKQVALGKAIDLETRRKKMFDYFGKIGVSQAELLQYCGVKNVDELDSSMVFELRGLANAIKEGTTSVQKTFKRHTAEADKIATEARKKSEDAMQRSVAAKAKANLDKVFPLISPQQAVDEETGEVTENVEPKEEKQ
jgi:phosphoribosylformylglycinamidine (FGAM) synthase PurS component